MTSKETAVSSPAPFSPSGLSPSPLAFEPPANPPKAKRPSAPTGTRFLNLALALLRQEEANAGSVSGFVILQTLFRGTVHDLQAEISELGDTIVIDTKHIYAWVKENNPREFITDRYDPDKQPSGDPDCRLGVKRSSNQDEETGQQAKAEVDGMAAIPLNLRGHPKPELGPGGFHLEAHKTFICRDDAGAVEWAYPVTVAPTPHRLTFNTGERVYAA